MQRIYLVIPVLVLLLGACKGTGSNAESVMNSVVSPADASSGIQQRNPLEECCCGDPDIDVLGCTAACCSAGGGSECVTNHLCACECSLPTGSAPSEAGLNPWEEGDGANSAPEKGDSR